VDWKLSKAVPASKSVATAFLGKRGFILIGSPDVQCEALTGANGQCVFNPRRCNAIRSRGAR
jgi:hypothetical protein